MSFLLLSIIGLGLFLVSLRAQRHNSLAVAGLSKEVDVYFDSWGVPHIFAQNEHDLYLSFGYLHAQDRLFQMEIMRRVGKGELAEIFGEKVVKFDHYFRILQLNSFAKQMIDKLEETELASKALDAYLEGVNHFIAEGKTPIEYRVLGLEKNPFVKEDVYVIAALMAHRFSKSLIVDPLLTYIKDEMGENQIAELGFPLPLGSKKNHKQQTNVAALTSFALEAQNLIDGIASFEGSNAWLVSGEKTASGKPYLVNDPHIGYSQPSVWYEAHLNYPGFELYGHHLAGVPTALLGHNREMGWGITMLQNKDMRLYEEKTSPDDAQKILYHGEWISLTSQEEIIKVKNGDDVKITVRRSPRGPIINDVVETLTENKHPISMEWDFFDSNNHLLSSFYGMAHSHDLNEFQSYVSQLQSPGLNILYANAKGDIGWWTAARIPTYQGKDDPGTFLLDGSNPAHEPTGFLAPENNPHSVNPKSGLIYSANYQVEGKQGPLSGYFSIASRYERLEKLLDPNKTIWTIDDMKAIQLDTVSDLHQKIAKPLSEKLLSNSRVQKHNLASQAATKIGSWNGSHDRISVEATLYHEFEANLIPLVFEPLLPPVYYEALLKTSMNPQIVPVLLQNTEGLWWQQLMKKSTQSPDDIIADAWIASIEELSQKHGKEMNKWHWEKVNILEHEHPLGKVKPLNFLFNVGPFHSTGASEVLQAQSSSISKAPHSVRAGPSTRRIIDFANPIHSLGINPTGQSGYFFDKHYNDQSKIYLKGEYREQIMDEAQIKSEGSLLKLLPQ